MAIDRSLSDAHNHNFLMSFSRFPGVSFKCVTVTTPGLSTSPTTIDAPYGQVFAPGSKVLFEQFQATFIVDEDYSNWLELHNWFLSVKSEDDVQNLMSDFSVIIPNNHYHFGLSFNYVNAFPTSIAPIDLDSRVTTNEATLCQLTMQYSDITITRNA